MSIELLNEEARIISTADVWIFGFVGASQTFIKNNGRVRKINKNKK